MASDFTIDLCRMRKEAERTLGELNALPHSAITDQVKHQKIILARKIESANVLIPMYYRDLAEQKRKFEQWP